MKKGEDEQLPGQMNILDFIAEEPQRFEDYIGKCKHGGCMKGYDKDCADCVNCDLTWGFMCTCHYSYDDEEGHHQVGQDVHRSKANKCDFYATEKYERDEVFAL